MDHIKKYKPPKEFMEVSEGFGTEEYRPTGPDGRGWGKYRNLTEAEVKALETYEKDKVGKKELTRRQKG